ncbi:MAG: hypothetical protein LUO87_00635 [Methanomicrobiales archaeon]|nr:hypothetical protein [Methanomicrobiales archaeon]
MDILIGGGVGRGETPLPSPSPREDMAGSRCTWDIQNRYTIAIKRMVARTACLSSFPRREHATIYKFLPRVLLYLSAGYLYPEKFTQ